MKKIASALLIISSFIVKDAISQTLLRSKENTHQEGVTAICLSNDASIILTGGEDTKTYLWNFKNLEKLKGALKHNGKVTSVAINENNKFYISGSADMRIRVFDIEQNMPTRILSEHTAAISALAINPMNDFFASGSKDNTIKVWDNSKSKNSLYTINGHQKEVTGLAFSPDGKILCSSSLDNSIKFWNAVTGELNNTIETELKGVTCLTYSSDGKYLAAAGANGNILVLDGLSGKRIIELEGYKSEINALTISGDGQYIAAGGKDKKIMLWKLESGKAAKSFIAHEKDITGLWFSSQGDALLSSSIDGSIRIWDVSDLHIGKRKFVKSEGPAILNCTNISIADENSNGVLEGGEKASIVFELNNEGKGASYNIFAKVSLETASSHIKFDKNVLIGNLDANKKQIVKIPIHANAELLPGSNAFTISIVDANGIVGGPFKLNFQTKAVNNYSYIMVLDQSYHSATGSAVIGVPITAKIKIKNITKGEAKNVKINFLLPEHVFAVNKISETIATMAAGEEKEVHIDFYADKKFSLPAIKIGLDIQGAAFSNAKDIVLEVKMNEKLPLKIDEKLASISKSHPTITMVQPKMERGQKIVWLEKEIVVKGEVYAEHPIHELLINGVKVHVTTKSFSHAVKLSFRENNIILKATDTKGNVTEHSFIVERQMKVDNLNDTLKRQGTDYALIIVTDDYQNYNKLTNPVYDGQTIAKELQESYGFKTEILKNPTRSEIYLGLRNYSKKTYHDDDQLLIFIAGHGEFDDVFSEGYIVTTDSKVNEESKESYISHSNLRTIINNIPCKHILLTMDVCFGGTFDQFVASSRGQDFYTDLEKNKFILKKLQYSTRKYLTSGGKEYVPDGRPGEHSPFARKYLDALRSYGGQDGILTFNELYAYVEKSNPGPKIGEFGSNQPGSDFLFIYKSK